MSCEEFLQELGDYAETTCDTCPAPVDNCVSGHSRHNDGNTTCQLCELGYELNDAKTECAPSPIPFCMEGSTEVVDDQGNRICQECEDGYAPSVTGDSCTVVPLPFCMPGQTIVLPDIGPQCEQCEEPYDLSDDFSECLLIPLPHCADGSTVAQDGEKVCLMCADGYLFSDEDVCIPESTFEACASGGAMGWTCPDDAPDYEFCLTHSSGSMTCEDFLTQIEG